ncbi:uncharacterized protein M6B38_398985 [Iris pallida]|uniref:Uncharacterized protein n=1 Tax=Iris pallida TaxID=29817 RepID=A0AAX6FUF6_IRIPA|nr:uncharacterized protein M6B38_398985 [Iris pallida]
MHNPQQPFPDPFSSSGHGREPSSSLVGRRPPANHPSQSPPPPPSFFLLLPSFHTKSPPITTTSPTRATLSWIDSSPDLTLHVGHPMADVAAPPPLPTSFHSLLLLLISRKTITTLDNRRPPPPFSHGCHHHLTVGPPPCLVVARLAFPTPPGRAHKSAAAAANRSESSDKACARERRCRAVAGRPPALPTPPWLALLRAHPRLSPPGGQRPSGRAVKAIRAFCTTFRRDAREIESVLALRRSDFARIFPEIRPLDRRFLRSVVISFCGANFVSLYLLHRSSVWRATSSCAKLDSVASVGPSILISSGPQANSLEVPASLEETH